MSIRCGTALASSFAIPCRRFYSATVAMDPLLASGTYYLCLVDAADASVLPDGGDLSHAVDATHPKPLLILPVVHASGKAETFNLDVIVAGDRSVSGHEPTTGAAVVYLSSTAPTSIAASDHLWLVTAVYG